MEAIKEKESVFIRVFRVFRDQKNKSELFGTMRNDAEPCGYFRMTRVVSLHCRYIRRCTGERSISEDTI